MTHVPRVTVIPLKNGRVTVVLPDGQKACTKCRRRPRAPGQRWCQVCRTEYNWQRRAGMVEVLLTPEEWAKVRADRGAVEAGRRTGARTQSADDARTQ